MWASETIEELVKLVRALRKPQHCQAEEYGVTVPVAEGAEEGDDDA